MDNQWVGVTIGLTFIIHETFHFSNNPFIQFDVAGREGLEPPTDGFGDRYSTN